MLRLPHRIVYAPRIAAIGGHTGITILFWTFCAQRQVSPRFVRHEQRHVQQWCVLTVAAALLIAGLAWVQLIAWWWLLASPLGFVAPYFLSFIPNSYRGSWFERDAERYADRRA